MRFVDGSEIPFKHPALILLSGVISVDHPLEKAL
jgi:hypothetical protein